MSIQDSSSDFGVQSVGESMFQSDCRVEGEVWEDDISIGKEEGGRSAAVDEEEEGGDSAREGTITPSSLIFESYQQDNGNIQTPQDSRSSHFISTIKEDFPLDSPGSPTPSSLASSSFISLPSSLSLSRTSSPFSVSSDSPPLPSTSFVRTTGTGTHSRNHWAVKEGKRRAEEQGTEVGLLIPTLKLPRGSFISEQEEEDYPASLLYNRVTRRREILDIGLVGTNRTTNLFLKQLSAHPGIEVYRTPSSNKVKAHRTGENGGTVDLVVFSSSSEPGSEGRRTSERGEMIARIKVFGDGQEGNLSHILQSIEHNYTRLSQLLTPNPVSGVERDLNRLISSWVDSGKETEWGEEGGWFDWLVVTGDKRFLLDREYETLVRVMAIVPTVCYPKTLEEHLMGHLPLPFYKLVSEDDDDENDQIHACHDPTPRPQVNPVRDGYFSTIATHRSDSEGEDETINALVNLLRSPRTGTNTERYVLSRENIRSIGIQHFLAWRRSINAGETPIQKDRKALVPHYETRRQIPLDSSATSAELKAIPTLARETAAAKVEWEAGLSRRHAVKKRNDLKRRMKRRMGSRHDLENLRRGVPWDTSSIEGGMDDFPKDLPVSEPSNTLVREALHTVIWSFWRKDEHTLKGRTSWGWLGLTCLGFAAGIGCLWLSTEFGSRLARA